MNSKGRTRSSNALRGGKTMVVVKQRSEAEREALEQILREQLERQYFPPLPKDDAERGEPYKGVVPDQVPSKGAVEPA